MGDVRYPLIPPKIGGQLIVESKIGGELIVESMKGIFIIILPLCGITLTSPVITVVVEICLYKYMIWKKIVQKY